MLSKSVTSYYYYFPMLNILTLLAGSEMLEGVRALLVSRVVCTVLVVFIPGGVRNVGW